ncbi:MAG: UDP-glucose dehydrogenase family protein [Pseudohongiellaceae bacterium]
MRVTIFGTGYVGLVQAAVFADVGHDVCCVDIDEAKVRNLENGIMPIFEPGLKELVQAAVEEGRLAFTTDAAKGVAFGNVQFISVGTPPEEDGSADLQYVLAVASTIAQHMSEEKIVVDKSTVPVGTADKVRETMASVLEKRGVAHEFHVVSNPEFLKEGAAVSDCQRPDRIIVGTDSGKAEKVMRELYQPFNRNHDKLIIMDARSAEMTKYAANCMLATKISFMNEMANIAERVGADIEKVRQGIGSDPRIGFQFIYPGCGYGGSCFPKDVKALINSASQNGFEPCILNAVEAVNQYQKTKLFEYISRFYQNGVEGKTFALWGLSFKPNTDDVREASSRVVMEQLWQAGAQVVAFDPEARDAIAKLYPNESKLRLVDTKEAALDGADALVICTEWQNFRAPDFSMIKERLKDKVIFDGRNMYDPGLMKEKGLAYFGIGRSSR